MKTTKERLWWILGFDRASVNGWTMSHYENLKGDPTLSQQFLAGVLHAIYTQQERERA